MTEGLGTGASILLIAAGVATILTALTLIGEHLRGRRAEPDLAVEVFNVRVNAWWGMSILLSLALLAGKVGVLILFAFASLSALREFVTLTAKRPADHLSLALGFFVLLPAQYLLVGFEVEWAFTLMIPVYAFLWLPVITALRGDPDRFLTRVAETQWALMICVFCASHVPALVTLDLGAGEAGRGVLLIVFLVMCVQTGDLADYYVGRRIGRRRIAPGLSPRTWEGAAAGLLAAGLTGAVLFWVTPLDAFGAFGLGMLGFAVGLPGSFVFRAIKRDRGVQDFSHLIPGHGGFLDQLDTVIFAAPVFFHVCAAIW
ncbi:MAG: phosphatidate cytidylyltransferase [Paracoccaceae bacterium]